MTTMPGEPLAPFGRPPGRPMFRRSLSDEFVSRLCAAPFWPNVVSNPELQPEIRDGTITIYCRGSGLVRDLRLDGGRWAAWTHPTFVPAGAREPGRLELRCDDPSGLTFAVPPTAVPPGLLSAEAVSAYRARLPARPEDVLKDAIVRHPGNAVLGQEVAFADSRSDRDRVDLCAYLGDAQAAALVEIKRIEDARLAPKDGAVEVIAQLAAYGRRLATQGAELLAAFQAVVQLKRRLGLGGRLGTVPEGGPARFLAKPLLVIGGCAGADVEEIREGRGRWAPLLRDLPGVAAGLILCGEACKLVARPNRHTLVFG